MILYLIGVSVLAWLLAQIIWQLIYSKLLIRFQNQRIDAAYSKLIRVIFQAKKDFKKGGD